jgi:hypothetical protein
MDFLAHLWLPILVSGVAVWIVSALCWMAIGHHNKDTAGIPNEQDFTDTIRRLNLKPGNYGFPDFQKCKSLPKEEKAKFFKDWDKNPSGLLRVWAPANMGVNMFMTFLFYLVTSVVLAYLGWIVLPHGGSVATTTADTHISMGLGSSFSHVFRVISTAAVLAYCFASFPNDLWFQKSRRAMLMNLIDGVVFALITGAVFAWLWPK